MTASDHLKHRTSSLGGDQDEKTVQELLEEIERGPGRRKHTQDWYAAHYGKLEDWARKILPEPWRNQFFSCIANGTYGHEDVGTPYMCNAGFMVTPSGYMKFDSAQEQILHDQCTRAEDAEAALAQKTRECEELKESQKPKCPDCNAVGMRHCSDPENCGGLYWPDSLYRALEAQVEQLQRQVAEMRDQNFQQQQQLDARVQDIQQAIRNSGKLMDHITALKACIEGLLSRHKDGSDQQYWAEWDTAVDLLASRACTK